MLNTISFFVELISTIRNLSGYVLKKDKDVDYTVHYHIKTMFNCVKQVNCYRSVLRSKH